MEEEIKSTFWKEFFATDPDWNYIKTKQEENKGKPVKRSEYVKLIGADMFIEQSYQKYLKSFEDDLPF